MNGNEKGVRVLLVGGQDVFSFERRGEEKRRELVAVQHFVFVRLSDRVGGCRGPASEWMNECQGEGGTH